MPQAPQQQAMQPTKPNTMQQPMKPNTPQQPTKPDTQPQPTTPNTAQQSTKPSTQPVTTKPTPPQQPTMQTARLPFQQDSDTRTAVPYTHDHPASQPPASEAFVNSVYLDVPGGLPMDFKCHTCQTKLTPVTGPTQVQPQQGSSGVSVYITFLGQPQHQMEQGGSVYVGQVPSGSSFPPSPTHTQDKQQAASSGDNTTSHYAMGPGISDQKASTESSYINPEPAPNSVYVQLPSIPPASKPSNAKK